VTSGDAVVTLIVPGHERCRNSWLSMTLMSTYPPNSNWCVTAFEKGTVAASITTMVLDGVGSTVASVVADMTSLVPTERPSQQMDQNSVVFTQQRFRLTPINFDAIIDTYTSKTEQKMSVVAQIAVLSMVLVVAIAVAAVALSLEHSVSDDE
jgi:hypothetical protein